MFEEKNSCIDISATTNEVMKVWKSLVVPLQNLTKLNECDGIEIESEINVADSF